MKKLFIILTISLLIVGCKTTKLVFKEHLKTDLTTHLDSAASLNVNQYVVVDSSKAIATITVDHTAEKITRIEFAKPDSTGKQAILSQTVTERVHDSNSQQDVSTAVKSNSSIDKKQTIKTNKELKKKTESTVKNTTKTSWSIPWWVYLSAVGLVVCFIIYLRRTPYVSTLIKNIFNK